jgi:periplasmic divalent cation tolerance protein
MQNPLVVLCTVGKAEEAHAIAHDLVEKRLAACVNVLGGVSSHYRWKESIMKDEEWLLVIKSFEERFAELCSAIVALHSYEVPELIGLPIAASHAPYLAWLGESVM